jgi:hypothetical protein
MGSRKINDLGASTFLFSVICDRAAGLRRLGGIPAQASASLVCHGELLSARGEVRIPFLRAALRMVS